MQPRADIARILIFISDTADLARTARAWEDAPEPVSDWDLLVQPGPDFEFDQRVSW